MRQNMKRIIAFLMALTILVGVGIVYAEEKTYTINEALGMIGNGQEFIPVSDDLSFLSPNSEAEYGGLGNKFLVLKRVDGKKEFTKSSTPFADDFNGVSIEEPAVFLCAEQMAKIPEEYRASSLEEADTIIMAEAYYTHSSTITVTDYEDNGMDSVMPVVETPDDLEKLQAYLDSNVPVIKEIAYYPRFAMWHDINAYDMATGGVACYLYEYKAPQEIRDNPEAANFWNRMEDVAALIGISSSEDAVNRTEEMLEIMSEEDFLLADQVELYKLSIEKGLYQDMTASLESNYWNLVRELSALDSDEVARGNYSLIAQNKDYNALSALVSHQNYTGFSMEVEEIEEQEFYLGRYDEAWLDGSLGGTVIYVFGLEE